jgi:CheY-like chemotaxis protein
MSTPPPARILVVEDEPEVGEVLRDALTDLGYATSLANDGAAALAMVPVYRPDVVLLDLSMPGIPGDVVLERLREIDPALPVVIVTANTEAERARATLAKGAFDYVSKPFDIEILARIVAAAVTYRG